MRFKRPDPETHPNGSVRRRSWFALLPVSIGDETRWLERVTVEFVWGEGNWYMGESNHWYMERFIDQ